MKLTTDIAKDIRKAIKNEKGYTNRDVKVNCKGNTIKLKIINYEVDSNYLNDVANRFDDIDYDEATGEILTGGNTFIFIENHAINPKCKEIANRLVEYLKINKNPKTIDIDKEIKLFAYNDENTFFYKGSIFKNNDFVKRIKFKNERDLAKEIALLI